MRACLAEDDSRRAGLRRDERAALDFVGDCDLFDEIDDAATQL